MARAGPTGNQRLVWRARGRSPPSRAPGGVGLHTILGALRGAESGGIGLRVGSSLQSQVVYRAHTGRGPTRSRTSIDHNLVVVELRDTLTSGERNLVAAGQRDTVIEMRRAYRCLLDPSLQEAVKGLVGRQVLALLSDCHLDPDIAVEVFVLEPEP